MDLMDDDEEVLIELGKVLNSQFLENIGGPLFAPHLFKPLEKLCEVDETLVRDRVSSVSFTDPHFRPSYRSKKFLKSSISKT